MYSLFDIITEMLFSPSKGLIKVSKLNLKKTTFFYFIFSLLIFWPMMVKKYPNLDAYMLRQLFVFKFLLSLAAILIFAILLNGICCFLFKKSVDISTIFSALIFSLVPFLLQPVAFSLFSSKVAMSVEKILIVWWIILLLKIVKQFYGTGLIKSLLTLLLPVVFVFGFHMLLFAYLFAFLNAFAQII